MKTQERQKIVILGATGSIGQSALEVLAKSADKFDLIGITAGKSVDQLEQIAKEHKVKHAATGDNSTAAILSKCRPDIVLNAISGAKGLDSSLQVLDLDHRPRLCLANKESVVMAGDLLLELAKMDCHGSTKKDLVLPRNDISTYCGRIIPVDSEHAALHQCLDFALENELIESVSDIKRAILTASGGPFFGMSITELQDVTLEQALAHPTWKMGSKISIDSATLANKGLEVIEAHNLFSIEYNKIDVLVEQTSAVHAMIELADGRIIAQSGPADMRNPIAWALNYPSPAGDNAVHLFDKLRDVPFEFAEPDRATFGMLNLAYQAGKLGGGYPIAFNAANEVAVQAFVDGKIGFLQIAEIVNQTLTYSFADEVYTIEDIYVQDELARTIAKSGV